jgi:hypothetical protein
MNDQSASGQQDCVILLSHQGEASQPGVPVSKEVERWGSSSSFHDNWRMTLEPEDNEASAQSQVVSVALKFLDAFYKEDLARAWPLVHPRLRVCWVQWWATANKVALQQAGYELVKVADELAPSAPTEHPLWADFERVLLRGFRKAYPLNLATCGMGVAPRVIALDTEMLYVPAEIPPDGVWKAGADSLAYPMVMQLNDSRWSVLNWASDVIPTPGYPPTL